MSNKQEKQIKPLTSNQTQIVSFLERNLGVLFTAGDIQDNVFGRSTSRKRGFGNIKAINSLRGLVKSGVVFKITKKDTIKFTMYKEYRQI